MVMEKPKGMHLVCASNDMDDNDDWIILPGAQNTAKKGEAIRNGATVQLMHNNTGDFIQAHNHIKAVISGKKHKNMAVYCTEGSVKDKRCNWRVNLIVGKTWKEANSLVMYSDGILFQNHIHKTWLNCEGGKLKTSSFFGKDDIYKWEEGQKYEVSASVDNNESCWTIEDATPRA